MLRGVFFFDYGNISEDIDSFDISETSLPAGGGIRINFPWLGQPLPIGLYFGSPLKKEKGDEQRFFLFTIGTPF